MINETAFLKCANTPAEMVGQFDKPWNFVGEIKSNHYWLNVHCGKCNKPDYTWIAPKQCKFRPLVIVELQGYRFITDDMIEVMVWFGVCRECDSVYWARSGPPYRRASAGVLVG